MLIAISGASGFIGARLKKHLANCGFSVLSIVRTLSKDHEVFFDPYKDYLDTDSLEGIDALINLSGASIATRWNKKNKEILRASRINSTNTLVNSVLKLKKPPKVFIGASAVGIYGDRGSEILSEESNINKDDFLSKLCIDWECASNRLTETECRVVNLRLGLVLDIKGGMLKKLIPTFKLGLGATIGPGTQYMSWICIKDLLCLIEFILKNQNISGAINACSPNPVTNEEFSKEVASTLKRPCFFTIPKSFIQLMMGEMGNILITGQRAEPKKAMNFGFKFKYPLIKECLETLLRT